MSRYDELIDFLEEMDDKIEEIKDFCKILDAKIDRLLLDLKDRQKSK